eukprot:GHVS01076432.1.p1 GENE.GHVS01076432.1~~GHVS01076432.1.p1  ORF type:complete len:239 (+),score=43.99 GHVS01076432.1:72-719(+)
MAVVAAHTMFTSSVASRPIAAHFVIRCYIPRCSAASPGFSYLHTSFLRSLTFYQTNCYNKNNNNNFTNNNINNIINNNIINNNINQVNTTITTNMSNVMVDSECRSNSIRCFSSCANNTTTGSSNSHFMNGMITVEWWDLYITGRNPHYPPRTDMYRFLSSRGVSVKEMEVRDIEDFTKWIQTRIKFGIKYPQFPYGTLEDKINQFKLKYPLTEQ